MNYVIVSGVCGLVGVGMGYWIGKMGVKAAEAATLAAVADIKQHITSLLGRNTGAYVAAAQSTQAPAQGGPSA